MEDRRELQRIPGHWVGLPEGGTVLSLGIFQSYSGMMGLCIGWICVMGSLCKEWVCVILTLNYVWQNKMCC